MILKTASSNESNIHMKEVYQRELPHFFEAIETDVDDYRFALPDLMVGEITKLLHV